MRLFIGFDLPQKARKSVFKLQNQLKEAGVKGSWKRVENLHITLEFLGELDETAIPVLNKVISEVANLFAPLELEIHGLGAFSSFKRPHTLWTGFGGDLEQLHALKNILHKKLLSSGFQLDERLFKPHLSLASRPNLHNINLSAYKEIDLGSFVVNELILFESKQTNGKRVYNNLYGGILA